MKLEKAYEQDCLNEKINNEGQKNENCLQVLVKRIIVLKNKIYEFGIVKDKCASRYSLPYQNYWEFCSVIIVLYHD